MGCHSKNQMANNVDPNEMAGYEPSYQVLHCLQRYMFWSAGLTSSLIGSHCFGNWPFDWITDCY